MLHLRETKQTRSSFSVLLFCQVLCLAHGAVGSLNAKVGCHFLLQCMKVKSESEVVQSCPILSDPMDCSVPGSSVHGIFQARVLEWGPRYFLVEVYMVLGPFLQVPKLV